MKRKQQAMSVPHGYKELILKGAISLSITVIFSGCHKATPPPRTPDAASPTANTDYEATMVENRVEKDEMNQAVQKKDQGEDSTGWYYIEETTWIPVVDTLGRSLQKARHDISENRLDAAAANVRLGTAFLMDEIVKVEGSAKKELEDTVSLLNQIGLELEGGQVDKAKIDKAFSAAHRADIEDRWVAATTEEWVPFLDQPEVHLNRARAHFLQKELDETALEIRKAVAYMEIENNHALGEVKGGLDEPIKELRDLAKEVEKGAVDDVAKLDDVFTRIDYALAKHYYLASASHWEQLDQAATGYSMQAAAQYLAHAAERTKGIATDATDEFVQKTLSIAEGLIKGTGDASKKAGKQLEKMEQIVVEIGKRINSAT